MTLNPVKLLTAVAQHRTLSATARSIGVAPQTLRRSVARLNAAFEADLIQTRFGRRGGLFLSEAGAQTLRRLTS